MAGPRNRIELRQTQRLSLSPGLIQSVAVLALSGATLEEMMAEAASENPLLVYTPADAVSGGGTSRSGAYDVLLQTVAARPSLGEHLCNQIAMMELPPGVSEAAMRLAYDLDENGFFTQADPLVVALEHGLGEVVTRQAIQALQSCEPTGVAAFNLLDCIRLQLAESDLPAERIQLVLAGLPYFSKGQTKLIGPALGLTETEAREITVLVRSLDPAPGRAFDPVEPAARFPELLVGDLRSGGFSVELANDPGSRLHLDRKLAATGGKVVSEHLAEAKAMISAIQYRGKTLLEVGRAVVDAQSGYFSGREKALAPLTRASISERLNLHKSTVGRAISGKTLLWRGRLIELDRLFPAGIEGTGGEKLSNHSAQLAILDIVSAESPDSVLSDDGICAKLRQDGVDISRRTVAKYRKWLNIPSSSKRRRLLTRSAEQRRSR